MKIDIKQCSFCDNNIRIKSVKFSFFNDYGGIIVKCDCCQNESYFETINPIETQILKGGDKMDVWDDFTIKDRVLKRYPNLKELKEGILVIGDIEKREYRFNFDSPHIYYCSVCRKEVESVIEKELKSQSLKIEIEYDNLMNFILANHKQNSDDLVVELKCKCKCSNNFTAYFHKKFIADTKSISALNDLILIGTSMPINSSIIDGVMSKNDCKIILEKFIVRWNAIYSRLLVVTPFVGHQWLSQEEIIELWEWIKNYLDPIKTSLVTRTATYNKYKKACEEKGISLDILEKYGLNNNIIQEFTKKQDFHAKIYVGYSSESAEILSGSFNLMNGPSVENISFKETSYNKFIKNYISPMKIKLVDSNYDKKDWLRIFTNDHNEWSSYSIPNVDILEKIKNYI